MSIKETEVTFVCDYCGAEDKGSPSDYCPRVIGWRRTQIIGYHYPKLIEGGKPYILRHYCSEDCFQSAYPCPDDVEYHNWARNFSHASHLPLPMDTREIGWGKEERIYTPEEREFGLRSKLGKS